MDKKIFIGLIAFGDIELIKEKIMFLYKANNFYLIHYNKREPIEKLEELKKWSLSYSNIKVVSINNVY